MSEKGSKIGKKEKGTLKRHCQWKIVDGARNIRNTHRIGSEQPCRHENYYSSAFFILSFSLLLSLLLLRVLGNNNIWSNRGNPINHLTAPSIGVLMKYYTARWLEFCDAREGRRRRNYRLMNKFLLLSFKLLYRFFWEVKETRNSEQGIETKS